MKKTVAVIFGGRSAEHDVSIITAHIPIIQSLLATNEFDVLPIYIAKDGSWFSDLAMNKLEFFKDSNFEKSLKKQKRIGLIFDNGLKIIWPGWKNKITKVDIVFPAMHGTFGEDGSLAGLLRLANVPFVGCDLTASVITMDKVLTKQILAANNLPVVPYLFFYKLDWETNQKDLTEQISQLHWPVFVKPAHLGSSIGITKVNESGNLANAVEVALHYDDKILIEESVENLVEVTLPIVGNDILQLAGLERPLNKSELFNFEDKYLSGKGKAGGVNSEYSEIPAKIDPDLSSQVEEIGKKTYKVLECSGIARIDFLINGQTKKIYINELNPLPGSLYHHNWKKMGISGVELVKKLIQLAEEHFQNQRQSSFTFKSEILNQIGGAKLSN